ncbi:MAG: hypothetical protein HYZ29_30610 [Myxococcales bacterium]|nr:hypothetical protein [Myxococcales bacterium]
MKRAQRPPMGGTKKVTTSLSSPDLEVVRRLARRRHGRNLSAAFAELIGHASRLEAMDRVLEALPAPSPEGLARLEHELSTPLAPAPVRRRPKKREAA